MHQLSSRRRGTIFGMRLIVCVLLMSGLCRSAAMAQVPATRATSPAPASAAAGSVNLNTASQKELEDLPGVGAATAKKIIAGRPYASVADLAKAGVPRATIEKITPLVHATAAPTSRAGAPAVRGGPAAAPPAKATAVAPSTVVDLNTASEKQLEDLPGVGPATARKIVAGRPYTSSADLSKAGIPKSTVDKITPLVTASAASRPTLAPRGPAASPAPPAAAPPQAGTAARGTASAPTPAPPTAERPPAPGMVWANLDSKVYHREGDRFYGNTKHGQWMTEQQAVAGGYRAAKTREKKD